MLHGLPAVQIRISLWRKKCLQNILKRSLIEIVRATGQIILSKQNTFRTIQVWVLIKNMFIHNLPVLTANKFFWTRNILRKSCLRGGSPLGARACTSSNVIRKVVSNEITSQNTFWKRNWHFYVTYCDFGYLHFYKYLLTPFLTTRHNIIISKSSREYPQILWIQ